MTTEHTPEIRVIKGTTLPWRLSPNGVAIIDAAGEIQLPAHHLPRIISAVNNHAELLDALTDLVGGCGKEGDLFSATGMAKAHAVIAKVKGDEQ